jgi:histidinol-phosphate/aromatic aminotransferase/cobyric acid decarboxylase-like protein
MHGDALVDEGMLDFAVNFWPTLRPTWLEKALADALAETRYPNESVARRAVARHHARAPEEVLPLNGAAEAFWLIAHALRPERAAVVHPSFTEPEAALRAVGADVIRVMRDPETWAFDPSAVPDDVDLVVVGNPNNPTGAVDPPLIRDRPLVVVDGSFADFVPFEPTGDVVVRSLTKAWGLAGIRAGYLLAPPELVERLEANRQPWSVNSLACAAIAACVGHTPDVAAVQEAREELAQGLKALGFHVWPSRTNFLLLEAPGIVEPLRQRGIAVRPCESFPGLDERHVRVAVRSRAENARLLRALEEIG